MASTHQPLLETPHKITTNCKILLFTISIFALVISSVFLLPNLTEKSSQNDVSSPSFMCHVALNPEACQTFVSEVVSDCDGTATVLEKLLIKHVHHMNIADSQTRKLKNQMNEQNEQGPLADCLELMDLSINLVFDSIKAINNPTTTSHADAQAWLSGVLTNHVTCSDGLIKSFGNKSLEAIDLENLISRARASLAVLAAVSEPDEEILKPSRGIYLPSWITDPLDRKLLQSRANAIKADLTVAIDGSENYTTVTEAIAAVPKNNKKRYVIYVKKGTYKENVEVAKNKKNLMIVGDGMNSTIITGNRNVADNSTTFRSATLAAVGEGFILQDICIQNTAGPEKHQAVALRIGGDKSVINRCRIDAYQDTLYTHSLRQFYRDSYITGTVDFIFGNAAVVFQKCNLVARKPMKSQKNMVTAQGRTDPNQNTATSIQDCEIKASEDLEPVKSSYPTYLGRPWKEYSRTVVMQSYIGDHIDPAGWSVWSGDFALKTLYYGEYMNQGPGAGTKKRVDWAGYHIITDPDEALKFTVRELIQGGEWLGSTGVAFTEGL